jgi:hypothetical protein
MADDLTTHALAQIGAAVVLAVVLYGAFLISRSAGVNGLVRGKDGRLSTSKFMAVAWTVVVAYIVLTAGFIAVGSDRPGKFLSFFFDHHDELEVYLVLLGGPYAAAVSANVIVGAGVADGTVQRTTADQAKPKDLVTNESGATDPYDFQYVLFNLVAIVVVLAVFIKRPALGPPEIPWFVGILTGGAAAAYTTRKALAKNPPKITSMVPSTAAPGTQICLRGENLYIPGGPGGCDGKDAPTVTVGGVEAEVGETPKSDSLQFTVPTPPPGVDWTGVHAQQEVRVTTNLGARAKDTETLTFVSPSAVVEPGLAAPT